MTSGTYQLGLNLLKTTRFGSLPMKLQSGFDKSVVGEEDWAWSADDAVTGSRINPSSR